MKQKIRKLLYRSFEEPLSIEDEKRLNDALSASDALRLEKESLTRLRKSVAAGKTQHFKPFFAEKVMHQIKSREQESVQERFFESLLRAFKPAIVVATVLVIMLLSYNLIKSDRVSIASAFAQPEVSLDQALDPTILFTLE